MLLTANNDTRQRVLQALTKLGLSLFEGDTVYAYVNRNRWVGDCLCNGAELVEPGHRMVCGSCGAEHTVVFPETKPEIESVLSVRPVNNRNWSLHETVAELEAENIEHGLWGNL